MRSYVLLARTLKVIEDSNHGLVTATTFISVIGFPADAELMHINVGATGDKIAMFAKVG